MGAGPSEPADSGSGNTRAARTGVAPIYPDSAAFLTPAIAGIPSPTCSQQFPPSVSPRIVSTVSFPAVCFTRLVPRGKWVVFALIRVVPAITVGAIVEETVDPGRGTVLSFLIGGPLFFVVPSILAPVAIAFSILRYRLWDIVMESTARPSTVC